MKNELKEVMGKELEALENLLEMLDEQHDAYVKKDLFALEGIVKKIQKSNVSVATFEVERRGIVCEKSMMCIIKELNDKELSENFNKISDVLKKIQSQKDNNQFLIKQGLMFTNKMLSIFRPNKVAKTYNNYGKMRL